MARIDPLPDDSHCIFYPEMIKALRILIDAHNAQEPEPEKPKAILPSGDDLARLQGVLEKAFYTAPQACARIQMATIEDVCEWLNSGKVELNITQMCHALRADAQSRLEEARRGTQK